VQAEDCVVAADADVFAGVPLCAALAEDDVAGDDVFVWRSRVSWRRVREEWWNCRRRMSRHLVVLVGRVLLARIMDVPPVFLAPNRFPAPFLGPFARPAVPWEAYLTDIVLGGCVGRSRAHAASSMTGLVERASMDDVNVALATAPC